MNASKILSFAFLGMVLFTSHSQAQFSVATQWTRTILPPRALDIYPLLTESGDQKAVDEMKSSIINDFKRTQSDLKACEDPRVVNEFNQLVIQAYRYARATPVGGNEVPLFSLSEAIYLLILCDGTPVEFAFDKSDKQSSPFSKETYDYFINDITEEIDPGYKPVAKKIKNAYQIRTLWDLVKKSGDHEGTLLQNNIPDWIPHIKNKQDFQKFENTVEKYLKTPNIDQLKQALKKAFPTA
ncbi:MAG: hypothetical protein KDD48_06405 [Bdellovibrionales bacterium]|nr:hypothetical protein [Bdellovibrionales bacterium]